MCYFLSFFKGAGTPRKSESDVGLAENGFAVKPWPKLEPKALVKKHFLVSRLVHMFVIDISIHPPGTCYSSPIQDKLRQENRCTRLQCGIIKGNLPLPRVFVPFECT